MSHTYEDMTPRDKLRVLLIKKGKVEAAIYKEEDREFRSANLPVEKEKEDASR